jgi:hypothetical protein
MPGPLILRSIAFTLALALGACGTAESPPTRRMLVQQDSVVHLDRLARETMWVQHPGGALFVAGYGDTVPHLWKSPDGGRTWSGVNLGGSADGAIGNSDVDLAVGPEGTLYFLNMSFDRQRLVGTGIRMAVSRDTGATWQWSLLSDTELDDRPWVEVAPDGAVHAIWNDGAGVPYVASRDHGRSWREVGRVAPRGGSSHLAIGPNGEVAVRIVPLSASGNRFDAGVDSIAISEDGGASWHARPAPGTRAWAPMRDTTVSPPTWSMGTQPRWVEPLAWDSTGALFSLWAADSTVWLARSRDRGVTWTSWPVAEGRALPFFPYLAARGDGELAATWHEGRGDSLRVQVAVVTSRPDATPEVTFAAPFAVEAYTPSADGAAPGRDTAGEYVPVGWLADGALGVATTVQDVAGGRVGFVWRRFTLVR